MFTPSAKIMERYADVLVNFALGGGTGIKKGEVVWLRAPEAARPLYAAMQRAILKAGGHVIPFYTPSADKSFSPRRDFFEMASEEQINFFPDKFYRGLIDQVDHMAAIMADTSPYELRGVDPAKIMAQGKAMHPYMEWRDVKESRGKFSWTLALFGTEAMAREARMPLEEYWDQITRTCFLDEENPIARWQEVYRELYAVRDRLNALDIESAHIVGDDVDLRIWLGERRQFIGGSGRNIPSFELFTSPDWRGTEGWIRFDQPLYRYGNLIEGIRLEFAGGTVTRLSADKNEEVLRAMVETENANKVGEFSLTDKRFSRISKFMAETLYDENTAGVHGHGNTHIALGSAYRDCYRGDQASLTDEEMERLGFNQSSVHTDIVSTTPRTVVARLKDGSRKLIYENGMFTV
ncbi:MAG: aminopeptidase [bacterium]|nr:aminopeptidase [bacterium]